jgi:predicted O-methyltransferase YrrM
MSFSGQSALRWLLHACHLSTPSTQVSSAEQAALTRYAAGRRSVVEIGVMQGASTAQLRAVIHPDGVVTGIDPHPPGRLGLNFDRLIALAEINRHPRGTASLIRRSSADAARDWNTPIDFLFIDGDHSWQGIREDWENWSRHVEPSGIVALHDSRPFPGRTTLDSVKYVEEVVRHDPRFTPVDEVETLTLVRRVEK